MKYRDGVGKSALQQAMTGILPDEVHHDPKQGFGTPMEEWMRGDFGVRAQAAVRRSSLAERGCSTTTRSTSCSPPTVRATATGTSTSGTCTRQRLARPLDRRAGGLSQRRERAHLMSVRRRRPPNA